MEQIDRINGLIGSIAVKAPVKVATTENITLSGVQIIDGVTLVAGASPLQRVLVKDQADSAENGIYDVYSGSWVRSPDFNGTRDIVRGTMVTVSEGSASFKREWYVEATDPIEIGTTDIDFVTMPDGDFLYLSNYASLAAAVTALGSSNVELWLDVADSSTCIVPSTMTLRPMPGGILSGNVLFNNTKMSPCRHQVFSSSGTFSGTIDIEYMPIQMWGGAGDYSTNNSSAFNAMVEFMNGGIIDFGPGIFVFEDELYVQDTGSRGGYTIRGLGASYHLDTTPTNAKGTILVWSGDENDIMFNMGSEDPIYIAGVFQDFDQAQFNNQVRNVSIIFETGVKSVFSVCSQDGFQVSGVYIDGHNNVDIRGIFDFRGAVNNIGFDQVTISNIPNGYGIRNGDGSTNTKYNQVFIGNVGLGLWIGDTAVYQDPYQNSSITYSEGTFEGFSGEGKFSVGTLSASASSGAYVVETNDSLILSEIVVGDNIFIGRGHDDFEMNRVTVIDGSDITLAYALEYDHGSGDIIKIGDIGVHIGNSSDNSGRTADIVLDRVMWDRYGCCVDMHDVDVVRIVNPLFASNIQRGLYIDGDTQNIDLVNPKVLSNQLSTWRLFEITDEGNTFNFNWWGGADKGGVAQPYINNQGEIDGMYIGSLQQVSGTLPDYFRGLSMDSSGIVLEEQDSGAAAGFKYKVDGVTVFEVTDEGTVNDSIGQLVVGGTLALGNGIIQGGDTSEPSSPASGQNLLFFETWGGKGHLYAKFPTGVKVLIATEP